MNPLVVKKGATVIVDGSAIDGAILAAMSNGQQRAIDVSSPVLADVVAFIDLLTQQGSVRFMVEETHATVAAALDKYFRHPQSVLGVDDLIVEFTDEDDVTHRWTAPDAAWRAAAAGQMPLGIASRIEYTVEVAAWSYENDVEGELPLIVDIDDETIAPSAAGSTTPSFTSLLRGKSLLVQAGAGAGAYTHVIVLPVSAATDGLPCSVRLELPASANPTIEFRNATSGGTLLATRTGLAAGAVNHVGQFVFNGTAWRKQWLINEP